ncbi:unnamed protein product [Caretta caretta]
MPRAHWDGVMGGGRYLQQREVTGGGVMGWGWYLQQCEVILKCLIIVFSVGDSATNPDLPPPQFIYCNVVGAPQHGDGAVKHKGDAGAADSPMDSVMSCVTDSRSSAPHGPWEEIPFRGTAFHEGFTLTQGLGLCSPTGWNWLLRSLGCSLLRLLSFHWPEPAAFQPGLGLPVTSC